ncbi:MAG TPA: choice-of-anchor P family protein [Candidatus Polarisedimenticolia bacterium]|jgi:hypothetical protein|nr:choice-of-anchor P family protein [Candidatus Polarisedimenticolia bacterium]
MSRCVRRKYHRVLSHASLILLAAGLLATTLAGSGASGGRASGAFANAPLLGVSPIFVADTGEVLTLSDMAGGEGADLHDASVPGVLSAKVLTATTSVEPGIATSSTSIADVVVLAGQPAELTAAFVRAQADVLDVNGSSRFNGVTEIDGLRFGGQSVTVTGKPNQRIDLLGVGSLIINEQIASSKAGVAELTVNALHLVLATGDQVILAGAHSILDRQASTSPAGLRTTAPRRGGSEPAVYRSREGASRPRALFVHEQPECFDFVTGGGWFEPRFEGGPPLRVNFGFNAGYRTIGGELKGHVNVVDHNDGTHIKGLNVDSYFRLGDPQSLCRMFEGDAEMNGTTGLRYHVEVCDYGEPGRDDRFRIIVMDAAGTMLYFADDSSSAKVCDVNEPRCGDLDGGNIQLHKPCDAQPASASKSAAAAGPQS